MYNIAIAKSFQVLKSVLYPSQAVSLCFAVIEWPELRFKIGDQSTYVLALNSKAFIIVICASYFICKLTPLCWKVELNS